MPVSLMVPFYSLLGRLQAQALLKISVDIADDNDVGKLLGPDDGGDQRDA